MEISNNLMFILLFVLGLWLWLYGMFNMIVAKTIKSIGFGISVSLLGVLVLGKMWAIRRADLSSFSITIFALILVIPLLGSFFMLSGVGSKKISEDEKERREEFVKGGAFLSE